jgi:integrase
LGKTTAEHLELVDRRIADINSRLAKVTLRRRGNALYLRATLPPKPGSPRQDDTRADIALKLSAQLKCLQQAEAEAKVLDGLVIQRRFDWALYPIGGAAPPTRTTGDWVQEFERHYRATHQVSDATWRHHWQSVYGKLPADQVLGGDLLFDLIFKTDLNTRSRSETCKKLQALASFAGVDIDLLKFKGSYSSQRPQNDRNPPIDELVMQWRDLIPNPNWQWFFGVMATFGLRPHEAWFCEFVDARTVRVCEGKTGPRLTYAFRPEWAEQWDLASGQKPPIVCKTYREYGDRAARQFRRYGVPFTPYALRHRYAIRMAVDFGVPTAIAASYMGHAPEVFLATYQRWISEHEQGQFYSRLLERRDPPKPI